jgi:hypothetical protein
MNQLRDQAAHFSVSLLVLLPFAIAPGFLTGALAGFAMGLVREVTEENAVSLDALRAALGSRLDLAFWTLGGATAGVFV